jgi:hypothetical protein
MSHIQPSRDRHGGNVKFCSGYRAKASVDREKYEVIAARIWISVGVVLAVGIVVYAMGHFVR